MSDGAAKQRPCALEFPGKLFDFHKIFTSIMQCEYERTVEIQTLESTVLPVIFAYNCTQS